MKRTKKALIALPILFAMLISGCQAKQGVPGEQGPQGEQGLPGEQGPVGETGQDGTSVLTGSGEPTQDLGKIGDSYVDLATWNFYVKEETGWIIKGNIKGETGDQGDQGLQGNDGKNGISIVSIEKTSEQDNVDIYTITYSDGNTTCFTVTNVVDGEQGIQGITCQDGHTPIITISEDGYWVVDGEKTTTLAQGPKGDQGEQGPAGQDGENGRGIQSIECTSSNGNVDIYTITYTDGTTSTFTVTNGVDGQDGAQGDQGIQGIPGQDGHTPTIVIGENGNWFVDGEDTGIAAQGPKGETGDTGPQGPQGETGEQGPQGEQGIPGQDGTSVLTGSGEPAQDLGKIGDSYIDLTTWNFYVKEETGWIIKGNIKGETGPQGEAAISVVSTIINENGDLIVTYSNGDVVNAGHVKDQAQTYTVTFNSNGGTDVPSQEVVEGHLINRPANPSKDNYGFDGWYTGDGDKWNFKGCAVYEDLTLYAHWLANAFTITYHLNGGTNSFNNPDSYFYGTSTITLDDATKSNAIFKGWYLDPDFTTECNTITPTSTGNLHFYAKFEAILYTFTFVTNGGSAIEDAVGEYGSQFPSVSTTRGGYIFKGWYKDSAFNTPYTLPDTFPALNLTLYAKWEQIKYTVKIKSNGNSNVMFASPEQSTTGSINSTTGSFTKLSGQKFYVCYKNNSSYTYKAVSIQLNTTNVKIEFISKYEEYFGNLYSAKIYEYNSNGTQTKTQTIGLN